MRVSKKLLIWLLLFAALFILVGLDLSGGFMAPHLGMAGAKLRYGLHAPLFALGRTSFTLLFLVQIAIFIVVLGLISRFAMRFLERRVLVHTSLASGQQYAASRILSYLFFVMGVLIGLQVLGLNLSSLLVVGGALGLGVGLGLQPIVSNFVAGLILLIEQPVRLGDRIDIGSLQGDIIAIRGRSTWVRTNDNVVIIVPNSEFIEKQVTNWTANDRRVRVALPVGVSYDSDPDLIRELLRQEGGKHPDVLAQPPPDVMFIGFGDSTLNFELRVWTERHVQTPTKLKSDLYFSIWTACKEAGVEIAFPQRDLHLRSISKEAVEMLASSVLKKVSPTPSSEQQPDENLSPGPQLP